MLNVSLPGIEYGFCNMDNYQPFQPMESLPNVETKPKKVRKRQKTMPKERRRRRARKGHIYCDDDHDFQKLVWLLSSIKCKQSMNCQTSLTTIGSSTVDQQQLVEALLKQYNNNPGSGIPKMIAFDQLQHQLCPDQSGNLFGTTLGLSNMNPLFATSFQQQVGSPELAFSSLCSPPSLPYSPAQYLPQSNLKNLFKDWAQSSNSLLLNLIYNNSNLVAPMTSNLIPEVQSTMSNSSPPDLMTPLQQFSQPILEPMTIKREISPGPVSVATFIKSEIDVSKRRPRKSKAKVTLIPGLPPVQRIRRRKRNGSIPEDDPLPSAPKVAPPGCKQPIPPSPEEQSNMPPEESMIYSPPSLRLNHGTTSAFQIPSFTGNGPVTAANEMRSTSPDSQTDDAKRSKTCRVCGDTATGYNFNVISCESCKAFFRRNALRPKTDFKCPYSEDCDINAVSRRFCQKCRLRKCFDVGMKKEWILNDEQLKRRKNSRLNNMKSAGNSDPNSVTSPSSQLSPYSPSPQSVAIARNAAIVDSVTTSVRNEAMRLGNFRSSTETSTISPPSVANPMTQPMISPTSISPGCPPSQLSPRMSADALNQLKPIPLAEIVAAMMQTTSASVPPLPPPIVVQCVKIIAFSQRLLTSAVQQLLQCGEYIRIDLPLTEYTRLIAPFSGKSMNELANGDFPLPDEAYSSLRDIIHEHVQKTIQKAAVVQKTEPISRYSEDYSTDQVRTTSLLPNGAKYDDLTQYNMGPPPQINTLSPESRQHTLFIENAIASALETPSEGIGLPAAVVQPAPLIPANAQFSGLNEFQEHSSDESKTCLQLNSIELKEMDSVRNAFTCMDEPLQDCRAAELLRKANHAPSDIMNIMDVTIRRYVRTAKKLCHFQEISNDGKLQLLKSAMIDMLTIRGVMLLDEKMEAWKTSILGETTSISCNMFDKLSSPEQRTRFCAFCSAIHPELRKNRVAIMLIALVVLFDNTRATTLCDSDQEIVRRYHELYYHLLQRYVESIYGEYAPEMIKTVPVALRQLAKINESSSMIFMNQVNPKDVAQLPTEFFKILPNSGRIDSKYEPQDTSRWSRQHSRPS